MGINDVSVCSTESGPIACSQIMGSNMNSNLQWELLNNLSDSREFLKWMNWIVIDYDYGSWYLAQTLLKKLGAQCFYSNGLESMEDLLNNENIDFIIINPKFSKSWSNKILENYIEFLNFIKQDKSIKIFAYTADVMPWTMQTLKALEFADIITKPMNFGKFNNSLKTHLRPDLLVDSLNDKNNED